MALGELQVSGCCFGACSKRSLDRTLQLIIDYLLLIIVLSSPTSFSTFATFSVFRSLTKSAFILLSCLIIVFPVNKGAPTPMVPSMVPKAKVFMKRTDKHIGFDTQSKNLSPRRWPKAAAKISEGISQAGANPAGF